MTACIATLESGSDQQWQWALPEAPQRGSIGVAEAPSHCLRELHAVDRVTENSVANVSVAGRYAAVENLLDELWHTLVVPLSDALPGSDSIRFRIPGRLLRLPLTTARNAATGESLVHITPAVIEWGARPVLGDHGHSLLRVLRIDGHFRDVAHDLAGLTVDPGTTLLLMGCRTADLVPLIARTGAAGAVVSSWDVEDRHCGPFGDALEALLGIGLSTSAALRSLQARWSDRHPYEWAGYAAIDFSTGAIPVVA